MDDTMREQGSEREILLASLAEQRAVVRWKLSGLTAEQAQERHTPSLTNLLGLVKHLALVERHWFVTMFTGVDVDHGYDFESDPDAEFRVDPADTVDAVLADHAAAVREADQVIANASLDDLAVRARRTGTRPSLRWIVVHMIEETARHAGHADIVRELVDGATGYLPD